MARAASDAVTSAESEGKRIDALRMAAYCLIAGLPEKALSEVHDKLIELLKFYRPDLFKESKP